MGFGGCERARIPRCFHVSVKLVLIPLTTLRRLSENRVAMSAFNHDEWRQHCDATENIPSLTKRDVVKHIQYFNSVRECLDVITDQRPNGKHEICKERIELLRREIDQRRVIKPAWIAAIAGIAAVILAILLLVQDCSRSSSTSEARPTPTETPQPSPASFRL
jgi:hypothetical protein